MTIVIRVCAISALSLYGILVTGTSLAVAPVRDESQRCTSLQSMMIVPSMIGLPTRGATVTSAIWVPATGQTVSAPSPLNPTGLTLARPDHCEVKGEIVPVDPTAPAIHFQVNLPRNWNRRALHFGGGGFDGMLMAATGALPRAPNLVPYPLTRGYATFGSDGGHQGNDASFALNAEALDNFAFGHIKKTHDVAMALIKARYGRTPMRSYFVGQSGGGRQGLVAAQRFPRDYDGVAVTAPAIDYVKIMLRFAEVATALARPGGFLGSAQIEAFEKAVLAQCDANDGVADGIVGNFLGCDFDPAPLRCPAGGEPVTGCFTEPQLATLAATYDPTRWKDATGGLIVDYPRFLVAGGESKPINMPTWITGRAPLPRPQPPGKSMNPQQLGVGIASFYSNSLIRYMIARDEAFDSLEFDPRPFAQRIAEIAGLIDVHDPDFSAFQRHGGKLIMLHNTADLAISPLATIRFHEAMSERMGQKLTDRFVRLYVVPGGDHGGANAPSTVDLLTMLERWSERGHAPAENFVVEQYGADQKVTRTKPLCRYPNYPRYVGSGDTTLAASYRCVRAGR